MITGWLPQLFAKFYNQLGIGGAPVPQEGGLDLVAGSGVAITYEDDPDAGVTHVTIGTSGSSGVTAVTATSPIVATTTGSTVAITSPTVAALLALVNGATSGQLSVTAATVVNQDANGRGPKTARAVFTTTGTGTGVATFTVPAGFLGPVTVIIVGNNGTDGGSVTSRGKVMNVAGTGTVIAAFANVDTWQASSGSGASTWTQVVASGGTVVTATCTGSAGAGTVEWTVIFEFVAG